MLRDSGCQSWQNGGVQNFVKLLADALLYRHHPCFECSLGNQPSWVGIATDVKGVEPLKRLKDLGSSLQCGKGTVTSNVSCAHQAALHELGTELKREDPADRWKPHHVVH